MLPYPQIDPIIFSIGPLAIRWYGVMYLIGFLAIGYLAWRKSVKGLAPTKNRAEVEDMIFYGALGVILGGRIGYMLFYQFDALLANPLTLFKITDGGMSFHGGLIGVLIAMVLFARKIDKPFLQVMDLLAPLAPIGLGLGRLGNFINQELWGRVADPSLPWAMVFPADPMQLPRHPSQLYQFLLEGVLLFIVLQFIARKPRATGFVSGCFLIGYGLARFIAEFFRQPDAHIGLEAFGWMSRGQELSLPMIAAGIVLVAVSQYRAKRG